MLSINDLQRIKLNEEATRPLHVIAREILTHLSAQLAARKKPGPDPFYGARPYLDAMLSMGSIEDNYFGDSGTSVVIYCVSNLTPWKGPDARRIKAELTSMWKKA